MGDDFSYSNLPFVLSCLFDVALAVAVVAWAARGPRPYARLAAGAAVALALLAAKGVVMVAAGLDIPFGVMHVLWLDVVVVLPVAGVAVLASPRLRGRAPLVLGAAAVLLLAPVGAYASLVAPSRLVVERSAVPLAPERTGHGAVRVAVVADLQFEWLGGHERAAVDAVVAERPDVILIPGDIHQGSPAGFARQRRAIRALLARLRAPAGVYAVPGDTEGLVKARRIYAGTGVRLLVNQTARVRVGDRSFTLAGVERDYWSPRARSTARALEAAPGRRDVRVLLAHRPDAVRGLSPRTRVDLTVAGHTHGGQLQLPLVGALTTASRVPRRVASGGLHSTSGRRIYVSRGIGMERGQAPALRLGARPEVSLLTLR